MACLWVFLGRSLWFSESDSVATISKMLDSDGAMGGNETMLIVMSLQIAMLWLLVILLVLILYHWCVSGVIV